MNNISHFSEEEIAICADAINDGSYDQLAENLRFHLSECEHCGSQVLLVADISCDLIFKKPRQKLIRLNKWIYLGSITAAAIFVVIATIKILKPESSFHLTQVAASLSDLVK